VESERDVFFGRDRERDEIASLVTGNGFRAGLLHGEDGVGKTSFVRAGLIPELRDHGIVAIICENPFQPLDSLAQALAQTTGQPPQEGEIAVQYLQRIVAEAMAGQVFLFILDDIADALTSDDRVAAEIGDLFARVVSRSSGRARFLFCSSSASVHALGHLEKRTGSLFPPNSRYELPRLDPTEAALVLDRTIALAGIDCEQQLSSTIVEDLNRGNRQILPADLQIAAIALKEVGVKQVAQYRQLGGFSELQRRWLENTAAATGNLRTGLRLLAEFASVPGGAPSSVEIAALSGNIDPGWAKIAINVLQSRGVLQGTASYGSEELLYSLAHPILTHRIREVAAPAQQSARRAFELLGTKAAQNKRLSPLEFLRIRREGIIASKPGEVAVLRRTVLQFRILLAAIAALPVLLVILAYLSMSGSYYLDVEETDEGLENVVVRAGKPGWGWFYWLPKSPGFGSVIADTGLSKRMLSEDVWSQIAEKEITGDLEDGYTKPAFSRIDPHFRLLMHYATTGDEAAIEELSKATAEDPSKLAGALTQLQPVAKGSDAEIALVQEGLTNASPGPQTAALGVAVSAARRGLKGYDAILMRVLASKRDSLRRIAFAAVRSLKRARAQELYRGALALEPGDAARRELLALISDPTGNSAASAATATSALLSPDLSEETRKKARALLTRAFLATPGPASEDAARLVESSSAAADDRVFAMELLLEHAPEDSYASLVPYAKSALSSEDVKIRAAALPLYAKVNKAEAAGDLAILLEKPDLPKQMRVAVALAWGQVARRQKGVAQVALAELLKDNDRAVRSAAARAYGFIGRAAQPELAKIIKKEYLEVAESAAYGLVNSTLVGASAGNAVGGIRDLWKRKGKARRVAAEVYARMARHKASATMSYLTQAVRATDDSALHPIGVRGLCNALQGGYGRAARELVRANSNESVDVRRIAIQCVVDYSEDKKAALAIAAAMAKDPSGDIRLEVARVMSALANSEQSNQRVGSVLANLAKDSNRGVRVVAIRALATLGTSAPEAALEALPRAFERGDEAEKLSVLEAATKLGAGELASMAIADESPLVRTAAIDTAIGTKTKVLPTINAALADQAPSVRRAALERLALGKHGLSAEDLDAALSLAIGDADSTISNAALKTFARIGAPDAVVARLNQSLSSRSEKKRAQAAAACQGLVQSDPKQAIALVEPLLSDPSHDVRSAAIASLATAYATTHSPKELAQLLIDSERRANLRLVAAASFLVLAQGDGGREAAIATLQKVAEGGPPLARQTAALAQGLISSQADGITFLQELVP
jgi:hypothetical protein